jgi:hypothetical protein
MYQSLAGQIIIRKFLVPTTAIVRFLPLINRKSSSFCTWKNYRFQFYQQPHHQKIITTIIDQTRFIHKEPSPPLVPEKLG